MTPELHWPAIALRLLLTVIAGGALGFERSRSGHPAGLRTTLLVTLAASIAMIQMNLLIPTYGKPGNSYVVMDLMRLPLGILTGVGFIGAGAIVKKGEGVMGVTTAATMWFATVVGLCLGGGQIILGSTSTVIGFLILWALRFWERSIEVQQRGVITVTSQDGGLSTGSFSHLFLAEQIKVNSASVLYDEAEHRYQFRFEVRWRTKDPALVPAAVTHLRQIPGVVSCEWSGTGQNGG